MPSFSEFSTTPSSNTSAGGTNIGEGCAAANINDALRYSFACGRALYDAVTAINVSGYMPLTGGAFTNDITRSGSGGYFYHAGATQSKAPVYTQPSATALPSSPAEGTVVLQY